MTSRREYELIHRLAKFIICSISTGLVISALFVQNQQYLIAMILINNVLYWFGVNTVAYILESMLNYKHRHGKL